MDAPPLVVVKRYRRFHPSLFDDVLDPRQDANQNHNREHPPGVAPLARLPALASLQWGIQQNRWCSEYRPRLPQLPQAATNFSQVPPLRRSSPYPSMLGSELPTGGVAAPGPLCHLRGAILVPRPPLHLRPPFTLGSVSNSPAGTACPPVFAETVFADKPSTMGDGWNRAGESLHREWLVLLNSAGHLSSLWQDSQASINPHELQLQVIRRFAPSTLQQYLRAWRRWAEFCGSMQRQPFASDPAKLADFLQSIAHGTGSGSASHVIRGLTWVARHAGLQTLQTTLQHPMVACFAQATKLLPRREAAPLPLIFLIWLELQILESNGSAAHRFRCGCLLVMAWASLRWSDCQWIKPSSLVMDAGIIRGMAARTKTTNRGMPFGFICNGFLGHAYKQNWGSAWFEVVQQMLSSTRSVSPPFEADFLIAECGPDPIKPFFQAPMSRDRGVTLIRSLLHTCLTSHSWVPTDSDFRAITAHSLKVTLLSWGKQLGLAEEHRRCQGHHRASDALGSVSLYSRDDIWSALVLQKEVVSRVHLGFRPCRPQLRGGAVPLPEPPVVIPGLAVGVASHGWQVSIPSTDSGDAGLMEDSDSAVSSTSDVSVEAVANHRCLRSDEDGLFLLNQHSKVAHVAVVVSTDDVSDPSQGAPLRFACNARSCLLDSDVSAASSIPHDFNLCQRRGCRLRFDDMEL